MTSLVDSSGSVRVPAFAASAMQSLKIVALISEILLVAYAVVAPGWMVLLIGHLVITATLLMVMVGVESWAGKSSKLQMFTLLFFAGGPIGGVAALLGEQQSLQANSKALERWYNTIAPPAAPAVTLVDRIIDGRLTRREAQLPRRYETLLTSGTMQEKQALLAYLATSEDEPAAKLALTFALQSPDNRLRVQAAAVAAHTRARARSREIGLPAGPMPVSIARPDIPGSLGA